MMAGTLSSPPHSDHSDISGAGEINLGATSNDINIATATSGTVDITGADQVDITAGAGGINLDGTTNLNGNTINIGDANSDAIDLTGNTNINGGSLNITSNTTLEDATTLDVNSNTINLGDDNTDDITLTGNYQHHRRIRQYRREHYTGGCYHTHRQQ